MSCREQGSIQGSQEGLCLSAGAKEDALCGTLAVRSALLRKTGCCEGWGGPAGMACGVL